jgi:hypothetical protein
MKSLQSSSIVWIFIYYLFCQGALGLKSGSESSALPKGPSGSNFDPGILEWPEGIRILRKLAKRDDSEISRRRLKTKFVGDVEVVVKDSDLAEGRDWPMTLSPQLVRRQFDINVNEAQQYEPSSVIKTEYSTFTYFITSLDGSQTVTSTDIVISSNIVTETVAPTPALPQGLASSDYSPSPQDAVPSGYQVMATKTYFTRRPITQP